MAWCSWASQPAVPWALGAPQSLCRRRASLLARSAALFWPLLREAIPVHIGSQMAVSSCGVKCVL